MTNPTPHGQAPEALRLAHIFDNPLPPEWPDMVAAAAELRRQHARIAELEAQIKALSGVQALSAAPAVPAGWKAVPVNPTPEMWKAAKTVPDPNPPYPPHYGLVWDAMLAASPTPPAEQQAAQVIIDFSQVGTAGPFPVANGRVSLPDATMQDLARMLRPTYEAAQQAAPKAAQGELSYSEKWDAELGRTAMRFVDRAGDVHPGIDDAETICAEFYKAMSEVIERMPHVQRMTPRKAARGELAESAAKGAIMGAAYDFRDAHISGSTNLKRSAHAALEAAVDNALATPQQEVQEPAARYTIEDVRKARSEGYRNGVESSVPSKITKEMRHAFREKYKEGSIWTDRLDIALEGMLAAAPQPAPAPLSDAVEHYLEAQDALDNREYGGINAEPYEKLLRRRNASRNDLDAVLADRPQ